jgi:hypothetical protein
MYRIKETAEAQYWRTREFMAKVMFSWFKKIKTETSMPLLSVWI